MKNMTPKRTISKEEKDWLLSLSPDDITLDLLQNMFADHYDAVRKKIVKSKFNTYDEMELKAGEYTNTSAITTNVGLFIVNKFLFEKDLVPIVGYVNKPFSKKQIGAIMGQLNNALLEDKITTEQYITFLDRMTWIAFSINTEVCTSLTIYGVKELPEIKKAKKEYLKKHPEVFNEEGDPIYATQMEQELLKEAKGLLQNDPSMYLYESGARGSFNVAYKNAQIMQGPVYNNSTARFDVMVNSLSSGIAKTDIPAMSNSSIDGAYSKAVATGECGYMTKKLAAAFQSVSLDKRGSDCGSKAYDVITLTNDNIIFYRYNYIIEGSKLVCLDDETIQKYIGKTVKVRSVSYCCSGKKPCNKCAGDLYYLLGIERSGLTVSKLSNSMLNYRMKVFHDATVHPWEVNPDTDFV